MKRYKLFWIFNIFKKFGRFNTFVNEYTNLKTKFLKIIKNIKLYNFCDAVIWILTSFYKLIRNWEFRVISIAPLNPLLATS